MERYDYILVGQGIAGSVLALRLLEHKKKILVINDPSVPAASEVAAGIWNPVVFKRMTKSWMADQLLPEMFSFYFRTEKKTKSKFLHLRNIAKIFTEEQEKNLWQKKAKDEMQWYLDENIYSHHPLAKQDYSLVLNTGNLDLPLFLNIVRDELRKNNSYLEESFDYSLIKINDRSVEYKNLEASSIIFCEGSYADKNPFFSWIPFKTVKGEVLTIKSPSLKLHQILNKGIFILPLGDQLFKVGATYNWHDLNNDPSDEGRNELLTKLKALLKHHEFEVVDHRAGVRPSIIDRRPVLGEHPLHTQLKVFNGMGTKGVMLAPYFAKQFITFMEEGKSLDPEVNLSRFSNYFKKDV